uniref:Phage portal protein, PBSX family n=1 Tax=Candidatus Kentrum sp. LFY TaxID=2126342 RepID=A0A450WI29_9GAMM|nr:MAG: phage portal protein, PBSX family [Candidatus Kentron sp. LFY]
MAEKHEKKQETAPIVFSFGDPEPVLDNRLIDYLGVFPHFAGDYYQPPVSLQGLVRIMRANGYHETALFFKRNQFMNYWLENKLIGRKEMRNAVLDLHVLGNAYFQVFRNGLDGITRIARLPALTMRKGIEPGLFFRVKKNGKTVSYRKGEVLHIHETDLEQDIYGVPQYLGGIQSILLSEASTIFRRRYYINGAHLGYVLVTHDLDEDTAKAIKEKLDKSKAAGNFRSLYLNISTPQLARNRDKKSVELIPVGDIANKDEFEQIKRVTRDDILAIHRIPPALAGVMPDQPGGYGDIDKVNRWYFLNEVSPMIRMMRELNEHLPRRHRVRFREPEL